LTAVHNDVLNDVVFPAEVSGKRLRVTPDGKRMSIVYLDAKEKTSVETKLNTFAKVYTRITGKPTRFEFPVVAKTTKARH
jgi:small subunit ribosomal protein S7e